MYYNINTTVVVVVEYSWVQRNSRVQPVLIANFHQHTTAQVRHTPVIMVAVAYVCHTIGVLQQPCWLGLCTSQNTTYGEPTPHPQQLGRPVSTNSSRAHGAR